MTKFRHLPAAGAKTASATADQRPALVKTIDGFRDWLGEWWSWARTKTNRRARAADTTLDPGRARPLSPAVSASTRRLL